MNPVKLKLSLYILAIRARVSTLNRKFRTISSQKVVMVACHGDFFACLYGLTQEERS